MDKAVLKKFAIESRQDLMQRMENKIKAFYIDEEFSKQQSGDVYILANSKHSLNLSKEEYNKRELLIKRINDLGLEQVIEEAAYTWFNRIVAIRYMEIHDYLPLTRDNQSLGIRVLSSKDNTPDPEIMKFTNLVNPELDIDFKKEKYVELKDDNEKFKYILLLVCRKLGRVIPQVFDGMTDYIDILIPDNLLNESGFVNKIITEVPIENYEQVEIIGWLYQYYNQTEKDRVMSFNRAYKKNEIPYATQLFTPDWIVKYMVENTFGELCNISTNISRNFNTGLKYYIKKNFYECEKKHIDVRKIKFIDPCCGSGHVLVYAFEILYNMYISLGYDKTQIASTILKSNIYGLDIDERAIQLSVLSLLLKAREYDKNIFNTDFLSDLNIMSIPEISIGNISYNSIVISEQNKETMKSLISTFSNAKEIGSLLMLKAKDYTGLLKEVNDDNTIFSIELKKILSSIVKCAKILSQKYDIVVTNPPYMSSKSMSTDLKKYINKNYPAGKSDLFAAFILRCIDFAKDDGYIGMITMQAFMFLSSYNELRRKILSYNIMSLLQVGYNSFPELNSQVAHAVTFTILKNTNNQKICGKYYNLNTNKVNDNKEKVFLERKESQFFLNTSCDFLKLPNNILAYWLTDNEKDILENAEKLESKMQIKQGLATGNNELFVRNWFEVDFNNIEFHAHDYKDFNNSKKLYAPYNKGGNFRKWYGNKENIIKFNNYNYSKLLESGNHLPSREYYFKRGITWSLIGNDNFAARISDGGFVFDVGGSSGFPKEDELEFYLAFLCSKVTVTFLKALNPTINFQVGDIKNLPIIYIDKEIKNKIIDLAKQCIINYKDDWDLSELSWDYKRDPLIPKNQNTDIYISEIYENYKKDCLQKFDLEKSYEKDINQYFIECYKLENELTPDPEEKYITLKKPQKENSIKALISYAVGCMFGRYSLDKDGIVYTGGKLDDNSFKKFPIDSDNIIPITDQAYFNDDIIEKFKDFIKIVYGSTSLTKNIDFIAEALGKKGTETSEETIRRYFVNDFFNDHCKMYQKRPIYWLLDSGKKNGFKALIYMHRYNENLIPKARLDYLHRVQTTYEKLLSDVNYKLTTDLSMVDKKDAQKRQADLNAKLQEIKEYDEKIAHIANQRISIDLDDGVKVNYEKFKDILAKIR